MIVILFFFLFCFESIWNEGVDIAYFHVVIYITTGKEWAEASIAFLS
jgi:hypothetical protein